MDKAAYRTWIERYDTLGEADLEAARRFVLELPQRPRIDVAVPVYNTPEPFLAEAIASVREQIYPDWTLCLFDDCSTTPYVERTLADAASVDGRIRVVRAPTNRGIAQATNGALALGDGEFVMFLDHDDLLAPHALLLVACTLARHPSANLVYADIDMLDQEGERMCPLFKPDYDHDLLLGFNVVWGGLRRSLLEQMGGMRSGFPGSEDYDLSLRATELSPADTIHHIPHVLYHWRMVPTSFSHTQLGTANDSAQRALREHCERIGIPSRVEPAPRTIAWNRVRPSLNRPPQVTLIVEGATDEELPQLREWYVKHTEPGSCSLEFSIADDAGVAVARNQAARRASPDLIAFVDARLLPRNQDWLAEMASHFAYADCAAVGARIVGPDGRIEQCGVLTGVREQAGGFPVLRVLHGAAQDEAGYFGRSELCHRASAVTGGVLLVRRSVLLESNGFDEQLGDPLALDLDFCLRARERGFSLVTCPNATFQASRPGRWFDEMDSLALLQERWGHQLDMDPYYNPNLADVGRPFELAFPPRVPFPWQTR